MGEFVARWSTWTEPIDGSDARGQPTSKTSKSHVISSETRDQTASKTSKSPFAGFAGSQPPRSGEKSGGGDLAAGVAAMTLDEFATAGLVLRVRSTVLGCEVLFVSDDVPEEDLRDRDLPVYRAAELRKLAICCPRPRDLQRLHDVKTIFNGTIADVRPRDDNAR